PIGSFNRFTDPSDSTHLQVKRSTSTVWGRSLKLSRENQGKKARGKMAGNTWAYVRIISGTILGGILGFYVMDRAEKSYKEKVQERLRKYEIEMKKREKLDEFEESR
ncbi:hypothetical protein DVH24_023621, partial [Malus domestica]